MIDREKLVFREIRPVDKDLLACFFHQNNVPAVTEMFTAFPLDRKTAIYIAQEGHNDKFYALLYDNIMVGFSMLRGFDEGFIIPSFGIIIDHRYHNHGLGQYLMSQTLDQAKSLKCKKVRLSVYASNAAGRKIYNAIGFKEIERSAILRNGSIDEKIIMIKELE